jgi:hypothetical protein
MKPTTPKRLFPFHLPEGWGWKLALALAAFYAFCFQVRVEDKHAFNEAKPQILILTNPQNSLELFMANAGSKPVYFKGVAVNKNLDSSKFDTVPVKYTALPTAGASSHPDTTFRIRLHALLSREDTLWTYWSDGDLNIYLVKIARTGVHYFCELPQAKRADDGQSLYDFSWYNPFSWIGPVIKFLARDEWFTLTSVPDDTLLYPRKR